MDKQTEKYLRGKLERLQERSRSGAWMSESPHDLSELLTEIDRLRAQFSRLHEASTAAYLTLARESGTTDPERAEANQKATDEANSHLADVLMETDKTGNFFPETPEEENEEEQNKTALGPEPTPDPGVTRAMGTILTRERVRELLEEGRKGREEYEKRLAQKERILRHLEDIAEKNR